MFESFRGRQRTKIIAVLLGVVLWSPGFGVGRLPKLAQASEASCVDAGDQGPRQRAGSETGYSSLREGEDSEEDSLVGPLTAAAPLRLSACSATGVVALGRERTRLSAGYDVFARERGPPGV